MNVPSSVLERINRLEFQEARAEERRKSDTGLQAALKAAQQQLGREKDLFLTKATEIFEWRRAVVDSRDGKRLWKMLGGATVPLYLSWFWCGVPIKQDNPFRAQTRIMLDGPGHHFLIEEWANDAHYREVARPTSPIALMDAMHPELIKELHAFVTGPDGWKQISEELDRRLANLEGGDGRKHAV